MKVTRSPICRKARQSARDPRHAGLVAGQHGHLCLRHQILFERLKEDAADPNSSRDFGNDIIPRIVKHGKAVAHRFTESCVRAAEEIGEYWRDVGTLDAYFEANLDLTDVVPRLNMYDRDWRIWTDQVVASPAKFVHDEEGRRGSASPR
jgi:glucose-1-phosphate adenylyltransferase